MIPIYRARWGECSDAWAYSVRPDLWTLGLDTSWWSADRGMYIHMAWWEWHQPSLADKARVVDALGLHIPGVAEALVLAGAELVENVTMVSAPGSGAPWEVP